MGFLKHVLLEQKIIEDEVELEALFEKEKIDEDSTFIQSLVFDNSVFETKEEVLDWVRSHGFYVAKEMDETKNSFSVSQLDPSEFEGKLKTIDIRKGIKAVIGKLKTEELSSPVHLSLRNTEDIKLSEGLPHIIEIAKVVNGVHPQFGEIDITVQMLKTFIKNFENKVTDVDISIDYDHETREAAGWLKSLFLSFDEKTLLGEIKWTPKGALALSDREFRYFSPEYNLNYIHPHTGQSHGPTLLGGALVNRPFLKMEAIVELKDKTKNKKEVIMETISLKDHEAKIVSKDKDIADLKLIESEAKKTIDGFKSENKTLSDENKSLKKEKVKKEREDKYNKLFSENKINKAQLTALKEGKDPLEVFALAEKMNVDGKGKTGKDNDLVVLSEKELDMAKRMDLTAEEFIKYNKVD